ncbi:single-stranded DNA-binding protein [Agromyces mariniharenae]|nr:single-stranded DNA-binding protein [Agromyces mariniharenae]
MATTKENIPLKGRLVSDPARSEHENGPKLRFRFVEEDFKRENGQLVRDENGYPVVSHRAFHEAVVWYGPLADRIEGTLRSGDAFVATGDLRFSTFEDKDGNSRSSHEFAIQAIGADLASGRVVIERGPKAPAPAQAQHHTPEQAASVTR